MALETILADITERLRPGRFPNEQAISQGIVLRLLQELGWDAWETSVVWPEYQTGEGRVDFALCHPPSKPAIFIEVKQRGKAEEAVRQALEYAFHSMVGARGFEPRTSCAQGRRATRLRYAPTTATCYSTASSEIVSLPAPLYLPKLCQNPIELNRLVQQFVGENIHKLLKKLQAIEAMDFL